MQIPLAEIQCALLRNWAAVTPDIESVWLLVDGEVSSSTGLDLVVRIKGVARGRQLADLLRRRSSWEIFLAPRLALAVRIRLVDADTDSELKGWIAEQRVIKLYSTTDS